MALKIIWNKRALNNFNKILDYLEHSFGEQTAKSFVVRSYNIIEQLSENPNLGSLELKAKNIRGILISKHNRLFYRLTEEEIILLNFFDIRQKPKKKKY
ncbi:type II toxin-antitoxin system RelE/ParE family toxin [Portibacter lacus]|uniref:Type II toxin-antitoxin system RelE/ParE family toxin n=1 Tax=Portibacter lacus TaxID=1099794 RepID=A0AA37SPE1_9BACT|nr:hypothetical protein GCM10007940_28720 [Portibacter lacus]